MAPTPLVTKLAQLLPELEVLWSARIWEAYGLMTLASVDLNLLKAFDAMMIERQVTQAAARIGLTQPAMSNALARLRQMFDDQLFIRTPDGMCPTPRAQQLAISIQRALRDIQEAIANAQSFDPSTTERQFSIGMTDFSAVGLALALADHAQKTAKNARIHVRYVDRQHALRLLASETVDVVMGVYLNPEPDFETQYLFTETTTFLMRKGHPASAQFSLKDILAYPHLLVSPTGIPTGTIEPVLAQMGLKRNIHVIVPDLIAVPWLLRNSDLITAVALSTAIHLARIGDLALLPASGEMQRMNDVSMVWASRDNGDPGKVWMREALMRLAHEFGSLAASMTEGRAAEPALRPVRLLRKVAGKPNRLFMNE
jgi:DNA-binding transcriptional LysR family regulator